MTPLLIAGYVLLGVFVSRWTVGTFRRSGFYVDPIDDFVAMAFIFCFSVVAWPLIVVTVVLHGAAVGIGRTPIWSSVTKGVDWFYTLDRNQRKELLKR